MLEKDIESQLPLDESRHDQVNLNTLASIILPQRRSITSLPLTLFYYLFYLVIISGLLGLWGGGIDWPAWIGTIVNFNIIPLTVFMYCYEPVKLFTSMALSPGYPEQETRTENVERSKNNELAIIIPCHKSEDIILRTIRSCLNHVEEHQIFIMDNDKALKPQDNTAKVIHQNHPRVNYFFLPKTGNKTIAIFYGAQYARPLYPYSLIIDDDVELDPNFRFNKHYFDNDPQVKGLVFPLRAMSRYLPGSPMNQLITRWQDIEYQLSDLEMNFLDAYDALIRPHGAASLWNTKAMIDVLLQHNTIFHGEDVMMGNILQHMHDSGQHILRFDRDNYIATDVPVTYFGKAEYGNLWYQRVRSWSVTQFTNFWELGLKPLLTVWERPGRGKLSLLLVKESQLYNVYTQVVHIVRFPLMFWAGKNVKYWWLLSTSIAIQGFTTLAFNYLKLPRHLRNDLFSTISYPIYKGIDAFMGTFAFLRAVLIEIPTSHQQTNVQEMLLKHQLPLPREIQNNQPSPVHSPVSPMEDSLELLTLHALWNKNTCLIAVILAKNKMFSEKEYLDCELYDLYQNAVSVTPVPLQAEHEPSHFKTFLLKHAFFCEDYAEAMEKQGELLQQQAGI